MQTTIYHHHPQGTDNTIHWPYSDVRFTFTHLCLVLYNFITCKFLYLSPVKILQFYHNDLYYHFITIHFSPLNPLRLFETSRFDSLILSFLTIFLSFVIFSGWVPQLLLFSNPPNEMLWLSFFISRGSSLLQVFLYSFLFSFNGYI